MVELGHFKELEYILEKIFNASEKGPSIEETDMVKKVLHDSANKDDYTTIWSLNKKTN